MTDTTAAVTYGNYLKIDELLFIIIHQVYELWFKELLHEFDRVAHLLTADEPHRVQHTLKRILTILKVMVAQLDILETMTPLEFLSFRDRLESGSGFQSYQFRELEFALGWKSPKALERYPEGSETRSRLERRLRAPTLWDSFLHHLSASGVPVSRADLERDVTRRVESSPELREALIAV